MYAAEMPTGRDANKDVSPGRMIPSNLTLGLMENKVRAFNAPDGETAAG
jgi:hypothetical protein